MNNSDEVNRKILEKLEYQENQNFLSGIFNCIIVFIIFMFGLSMCSKVGKDIGDISENGVEIRPGDNDYVQAFKNGINLEVKSNLTTVGLCDVYVDKSSIVPSEAQTIVDYLKSEGYIGDKRATIHLSMGDPAGTGKKNYVIKFVTEDNIIVRGMMELAKPLIEENAFDHKVNVTILLCDSALIPHTII